MNIDIQIKNGIVMDPFPSQKDILIKNGTIAMCSNKHLAPTAKPSSETTYTLDAEGMYIIPGLIDFHTHLFSGSSLGVNPAYLPATGVTAAVDAGTSGCSGFENFLQYDIASAPISIKAFLNLFCEGITGTMGIEENPDPSKIDIGKIQYLFSRYSDILLGIKVRISRSIVKEMGLIPLQAAKKMANQLGTRLCVHITDPPVSLPQILSILETGDILCHMYHGKGYTILGHGQKPISQLWEARERGVLFDDANGRANFSFSVARSSIENGFLPDIISSDTTRYSFNLSSSIKDLPYHLSKYLNMGIPLPDIIRAVTETPAKILNIPGQTGQLVPGSRANITILKEIQHPTIFTDSLGEKMLGERLLVTVATVLNGEIVYRNSAAEAISTSNII